MIKSLLKFFQLKGMTSIDSNNFGEGTSFGSTHCRDSFNRFDECLTETILNYLMFCDKVLFESVSKLWSKVIYKNQKELQLYGNEEEWHTLHKLLTPINVIDFNTGAANSANLKAIKKQCLKTVLKKCKSIETIYFYCYCDEEVLQILGEFCPNLKTFQMAIFGLTANNLIEFGMKYGHRFERVELYVSEFAINYLKRFLEFCPNVKRLYTQNLEQYICEDKHFLPKLQELAYFSNDLKYEISVILKNKYTKVLMQLIISTHLNSEECRLFILNVSELENLKQLSLIFTINDENKQTINEEVILLGRGCPKLKSLELTLRGNGLDVKRLFHSFESFKSLQTIELDFDDCEGVEDIEGSVECFQYCKSLTTITLYIPSLKEEFFDNIDKFFPNLENFSLICETELTNRLLNTCAKLPSLKGFELDRRHYYHKNITDSGVCHLIQSCKSLEFLRFQSRPDISSKTLDALITHVIKYTKNSFQFNCGSAEGVDDIQIQHIDHDHYLNIIPTNLELIGNFW